MKLNELFDTTGTNHWEMVKYTQSGKEWEGYITEAHDDHIIARVKQSGKDSIFQNVILYKQVMRGLNVEFWFKGQGCDNSAIGVSGAWESLADFIGA